MVRFFSLAVLASALAVAANARSLTADEAPQLLAEAAAAPAAAPAIIPPVSGKAEGELTATADTISYDPATQTLTLAGPSAFVLRAPDGAASTLSPQAVIAAGAAVNAPQDVLVLGNSADGVPMKALVRVSGKPTGNEGSLSFPAKAVSAEEAVLLEGGSAAATKAASAFIPAGQAFSLSSPAVIVDGLRAPAAPAKPANGEANDEGSVAGGVLGGIAGGLICGLYCAIAGGGAGYVIG